MKIKIIDDEQDFLALKEKWAFLSKGMPPTNSFEWIHTWWKYNKNENELKTILAEENDDIRGIAPLCIQTTKAFKLIPVKKLTFLGGYISDYLDFIIKKDSNRERTFEMMFSYMLHNLDVDEINLSQINSDSPNFDLWQKYCRQTELNFVPYRECPRIDLSQYSNYEEYFAQLKKNHKRSVKYGQNKIRKEFNSHQFVFKNEITKSDLVLISKLNRDRQKALYLKGDHSRFCFYTNKKNFNFISDYFCKEMPKTKMVGYLKLNQQTVSYILFLKSHHTLYYWNTAFDQEYYKYSPTKILIDESIKYAFDNSYKYFDMMRGSDPYKFKWSNDLSHCFSFMKNKSKKSKIIHFIRKLKPEILSKMFYKSNKKIFFNDKPDKEKSR